MDLVKKNMIELVNLNPQISTLDHDSVSPFIIDHEEFVANNTIQLEIENIEEKTIDELKKMISRLKEIPRVFIEISFLGKNLDGNDLIPPNTHIFGLFYLIKPLNPDFKQKLVMVLPCSHHRENFEMQSNCLRKVGELRESLGIVYNIALQDNKCCQNKINKEYFFNPEAVWLDMLQLTQELDEEYLLDVFKTVHSRPTIYVNYSPEQKNKDLDRLAIQNNHNSLINSKKNQELCSDLNHVLHNDDSLNIQIFLRDLTGRSSAIRCWKNLTIIQLKVYMCKALPHYENMSADQIRLIAGGRGCEDHKTLQDYHVQNNGTVHVVYRLRGGLK